MTRKYSEPKTIKLEDGTPVVYQASEPEDWGKIPVRTEITVLTADDPKERTLGWVFKCYEGSEVYLTRDGVVIDQPLTKLEDLEVGVQIFVTTLVGHVVATVERSADGTLYWRASEHTTGNLEFDQDDRHCWTSSASINTKGLRS